MEENKKRMNSGAPENADGSAADKRFDVLDRVDFDDLSDKSAVNDDIFLEELFGGDVPEKSAGGNQAESAPDTATVGSAAKPAEKSPDQADGAGISDSAGIASGSDAVKASMSDTGTIEIGKKRKPGAGKSAGAKASFQAAPSASQVQKIAETVTALLERGKLSSAVDVVLSLRGASRTAVRENVSVTIPLGSRDSDLRRIAAGALIQSYLENGKIVRRDIEDKLYAIIESSEPEYDDDDEIIEQTPEDILYKVTACMTFVAELTERSGNHPDEKNAMYAAGDSLLDQFLSDNMGEVQKKNKKRLAVLAEAIKASGGQVADKFAHYYEATKQSGRSPVMHFLGDSIAFRVAAGVICALCLLTLGFYIFTDSPLLSFVAKDTTVMLFVIMAEVFFMIGMALLCVIIGFGGKMRAEKKARKKS